MKRLIKLLLLTAILGQLGMAYNLPTTIKKGAVMNFKTVVEVAAPTVPEERPVITVNLESSDRIFNVIPISNRWIVAQHIDEDYIRNIAISENRLTIAALEKRSSDDVYLRGDTWYRLQRAAGSIFNNYKGYYYPLFKNLYESDTYYEVLITGNTKAQYRKCIMPMCFDSFQYECLTLSLNMGTLGSQSLCFNRYIEVSPIPYGVTISVNTIDGLTFTVNNSIDETPAIKVNQVGYVAGSLKNKAYLGWGFPYYDETIPNQYWTIMTFDIVADITTFDVCHVSDNSIEYTGIIQTNTINDTPWNTGNVGFTGWKTSAWELGEKTYLLDFSNITNNGLYYIKIPTIGRSYSFTITPDALGKVLYHASRRLSNQRCTTLDLNSTYYTLTSNPHITINYALYPYGNYLGNYKYNNSITSNYGLFVRDISNNTFISKNYYKSGKLDNNHREDDLVNLQWNYISKNIITVDGRIGYHDAADCDQYFTHENVFKYLCLAFLCNKTVWTDNQWDIVDYKNNGIPDILDEYRTVLLSWERIRQATSENYHGLVSPMIHGRGDTLFFFPSSMAYGTPSRLSTAKMGYYWALLAYCMNKITSNSEMLNDTVRIADDHWNVVNSGITIDRLVSISATQRLEWYDIPTYDVRSTWNWGEEKTAIVLFSHAMSLLTTNAKYSIALSANYSDALSKINLYYYCPALILSQNTCVQLRNTYITSLLGFFKGSYANVNFPYDEPDLAGTTDHSIQRTSGAWSTAWQNKAIYFANLFLVSNNVYSKERARAVLNYQLGCNPRSESLITGVSKTGMNKGGSVPTTKYYNEFMPGHKRYLSIERHLDFLYYGRYANGMSGITFINFKREWDLNTDLWAQRAYMTSANAVSVSMLSTTIPENIAANYGWYKDSNQSLRGHPMYRMASGGTGSAAYWEFTVWETLAPTLVFIALAYPETPYYPSSTETNWAPSSAVWKDYPRRVFLLP